MRPIAPTPAVSATGTLAMDLCRQRLQHTLDPRDADISPDIDIEIGVPGGDAGVQAISGLMEVHGRDEDRPRRLALEIPSVGAALLASQGAIAAALAQRRGIHLRRVETSLIAGALAFLQHHLALETCGSDLPFRQPPRAAGPPFRTRDAHLIEIEVLLGADWTRFWGRLGIADDVAAGAWLPFVFRFLTGRCSLPAALHAAVGRHPWTEIREVAETAGVSVCRVRSYSELLQEPWRQQDHPHVMETPATVTSTSANSPPAVGTGDPLSGVRVVEVTSRLQGPYAALLLQQLGAQVMKVEPPGGDFGRKAAPRAGDVGAAYLAYNRRKQRVELDYKQRGDRDRLLDLIADADVFVQNWPSGRAEALGLDVAAVARVNPSIVYAHAAGWTRGSPSPCSIASDYVVQAHAALGDGLYPAGEIARPSRLTIVDVLGGLVVCEGVLAGLYKRACSGRGQHVETSLFGGAMSLQAHVLTDLARGNEVGRTDGRANWNVFDQPLAASDDYVFAGPLTDDMRPYLAPLCDVRDPSNGDAVAARIRRKTAAEWLGTLKSAGIPAERVCRDLRTLPLDPVVAAWLDHADEGCWVPARPWRFSA